MRTFFLSVLILGALAAPLTTGAQASKPKSQEAVQAAQAAGNSARLELNNLGIDWCATHQKFAARYPHMPKDASCYEGTCDNPVNRNADIPTIATPVKTVNLIFHIFRESDGSNAAATELDVSEQVDQLNADFLPSRVQFLYTTNFINNSTYRELEDAEEADMKDTYAESPESQLNVYVLAPLGGYLGVGTFPWDPQALTNQGGIIMNEAGFGPNKKTLTHEVGHCVGLWHTHHGVTEETTCATCYERADGANGDTTGDFCSDTPPTPVNFDCTGPGGTDTCSATAWGATEPQNYMGYAGDGCWSEFSSHQMGRIHCWSEAILDGWFALPGEGRVKLDRTLYNCADSVAVTLIDDDLANDGTATVTIAVTSGDSESLVLAEIPTFLGSFSATLNTSNSAGADNDGTLNITPADTITVTYNDASNGQNVPAIVTDTATLDCNGPTISNVQVDFVAGTSAFITFDTNENCDGAVLYGPSCGTATSTVSGNGSQSHEVFLTGLTEETSYRFKVAATDSGNNETEDDAGGACYSFTTLAFYDFFTEAFDTVPDVAFLSFTFTPDASPEGYGLCSETVTALPTNATGASQIFLSDDDFEEVALTGGNTVLLHGESYDRLWVNSNGNITFDEGDTNYAPSLSAHFSSPRVSAFFLDLDPSAGGNIFRKQTSDRIALTYLNIPEYATSNSTTMQVELFFDGRIRLTYLGIQARYGLMGLSNGLGVDLLADLTDFSQAIDCDDFVPFEAPFISGPRWAEEGDDVTLTVNADGLVPPITYAWTRDGLPVGGNASTYSIVAVTPIDNGRYRVVLNDASKDTYQTPSFFMEVVDLGSLPAAGGMALAGLAAVFAAAIAFRRK